MLPVGSTCECFREITRSVFLSSLSIFGGKTKKRGGILEVQRKHLLGVGSKIPGTPWAPLLVKGKMLPKPCGPLVSQWFLSQTQVACGLEVGLYTCLSFNYQSIHLLTARSIQREVALLLVSAYGSLHRFLGSSRVQLVYKQHVFGSKNIVTCRAPG